MMRASKKRKLEDAGWSVGDAADFLDLSPEESALIELKRKLTRAVRTERRARKWTQAELAARIGSSQSRVAKVEAGDPSVSLELVFRSLFAMGNTARDVARLLGTDEHPAAS